MDYLARSKPPPARCIDGTEADLNRRLSAEPVLAEADHDRVRLREKGGKVIAKPLPDELAAIIRAGCAAPAPHPRARVRARGCAPKMPRLVLARSQPTENPA